MSSQAFVVADGLEQLWPGGSVLAHRNVEASQTCRDIQHLYEVVDKTLVEASDRLGVADARRLPRLERLDPASAVEISALV